MYMRGLGVTATVLTTVGLLSGCTLFGPAGHTPEEASTHTKPSVPKEVREVLAVVKPLAAKHDKPTSKAFFTSMIKAGYDKSALEATLDKTPLDTGVPAKVFGVRVDDGCVVGEIRGGKATAQLADPTKSTGACLLGRVQRPSGVSEPTGKPRPDDQKGPTELPGEGGSGGNNGSGGSSNGSSGHSGDSGGGDSGGSGDGDSEPGRISGR